MEFRIKDKVFLKCNYQYEKELHSAVGKPNQKDLCTFKSAKVFVYEPQKDFKEFQFTDNLCFSDGKLLQFNKEKMNFRGKLPLIKSAKEQKTLDFNMMMNFSFDGKKLFGRLYDGETINIVLNDVAGLDALAKVKPGNITIKFTFSNPALGPAAIPLLVPFIPTAPVDLTANPTNPSFTIKATEDILDVPLMVDKIVMKDYYKITKKENHWKYKIDVQNYLWIKSKCDYKETDDMNIDFIFNKPKFTLDGLKKKLLFKIQNKKTFTINIIHNNSLDDPHNKNPMKDCSDPKDYVLDEELEFSDIKKPVKGRKS